MGFSTSLLVLAIAAAVFPLAASGLKLPTRFRDLEKGLVTGFIVVVVGALIVHGFHRFDGFGIIHLAYLLIFVTLPIIFGSWFVFSRRSRSRLLRNIFGSLGLAIALVGAYATHIEPNWLAVDRANVVADVSTRVRVGVLADLQTSLIGGHERRAIAELVASEPDLVVVPGDLFQGPTEALERNRGDFVDVVRTLVESAELVAVTSGDSDYGMDLRSLVEEAGALFIDDRVIDTKIAGVDMRIAGVRVTANGPDRANTLASLSTPSDAFTLLVSHRPDVVFDLPPASDVDLIIAGHTHGGQVSIPFFGPPMTLTKVPREIGAGALGVVENTPIYVSAGVGIERNKAPQMRFGVRPEVGIIDLVPS